MLAGLFVVGADAALAQQSSDQTNPPQTPTAGNEEASASEKLDKDNAVSRLIGRRADQISAGDPDLAGRANGISRFVPNSVSNATRSNLGGSSDTSTSGLQRQLDRARRPQADDTSAPKNSEDDAVSSGSPVGHDFGGKVVTSRFDVWVEGKWLKFDTDVAPSSLGLFFIGADYRISNSLTFGVLAQFDRANGNEEQADTGIDSSGWMVGPYVVARLSENLVLDGRLSWGQSDLDIGPAESQVGNSFKTERWLAKGQLTGDFKLGRVFLSPLASILFYQEDARLSAGLDAAPDVSLARLTFGQKSISTTRPRTRRGFRRS